MASLTNVKFVIVLNIFLIFNYHHNTNKNNNNLVNCLLNNNISNNHINGKNGDEERGNSVVDINVQPSLTLRGVTIESEPYFVIRPQNETDENGNMAVTTKWRQEGFLPDLLKHLSWKLGYNFSLYVAPDHVTRLRAERSMIDEVKSGRADFAIADYAVNSATQSIIFTEPFIEDITLVALLQRNISQGYCTLEDLVKNGNRAKAELTYGTASPSYAYARLAKMMRQDYVAMRLYLLMSHNPAAIVDSVDEGIERAKRSRYAFIMESIGAEYATALSGCTMKILRDNRRLSTRSFAIALRRRSPYLAPLNDAIRELKSSGVVAQLRRRYFFDALCTDITDPCSASSDSIESSRRRQRQQ